MYVNFRIKVSHLIIGVVLLGSLLWAGVALAGDPDSTGDPPSTTSFSLEDLYNRLNAGTAGTQSAFTEPAAGPGTGTMHSINEIMGVAPALDNTNGAAVTQIMSGTTYWGLRNGAWGLQTGTATAGGNVTGDDGQLTFTIPDGFYTGSQTATAQDADLLAGNIRSGVTLFGVNGNPNVVNTASGDAAAGDILSGQVAWVDGGAVTGTMTNNGTVTLAPTTTQQTIAAGYHNGSGYVVGDTDLISGNIKSGVNLFGVAGDIHGGCTCAGGTLTGSRWCDNGDGTVTDLLGDTTNNNVGQCLVWLKNANCSADLAGVNKTTTLNWSNAVIWSSAVMTGSCGLTDGSDGYVWRLPTRAELDGITNGTDPVRSSSMQAFSSVQSYFYWSSTTVAYYPSHAWVGYLSDGDVRYDDKTNTDWVWPVRGGQ